MVRLTGRMILVRGGAVAKSGNVAAFRKCGLVLRVCIKGGLGQVQHTVAQADGPDLWGSVGRITMKG
jgi:hypothetical protein